MNLINPYIPHICRIIGVKNETANVRTYIIEKPSISNFKCEPGQFIELTVFLYGEAPFSISSIGEESFEITVRRVGSVTRGLFKLSHGDVVGVRGPFGRGWPMGKLRGKDIMLIGGGLGIAPLRPVIHEIIREREKFGSVTLIYGARSPADILYKDEIEHWMNFIDVRLTVDKPTSEWTGYVGTVCDVLTELVLSSLEDTMVLQCGPPAMLKAVSDTLTKMGFPQENVYLSLERLMKCGMGFCGHCSIGGVYVCRDGPVFSLSEISSFIEKAL